MLDITTPSPYAPAPIESIVLEVLRINILRDIKITKEIYFHKVTSA